MEILTTTCNVFLQNIYASKKDEDDYLHRSSIKMLCSTHTQIFYLILKTIYHIGYLLTVES